MASDLVEFQTAVNDFSRPSINLPDGSVVTLSYGSSLHYLKTFKGENRVVELEGEAFFEVTPNKLKPFIIKTKGASVKVLGTSFNVRSYTDNQIVEVIVKTGKVELIDDLPDDGQNKKVLLLPGEKGTLDLTTGNLQKEERYDVNKMAWLTHEIAFQVTSLSEVIATLNKVYNTKIEYSDKVDLNKVITATFNEQDPGYILDVVALTLDLEISDKGKNSYFINTK